MRNVDKRCLFQFLQKKTEKIELKLHVYFLNLEMKSLVSTIRFKKLFEIIDN